MFNAMLATALGMTQDRLFASCATDRPTEVGHANPPSACLSVAPTEVGREETASSSQEDRITGLEKGTDLALARPSRGSPT